MAAASDVPGNIRTGAQNLESDEYMYKSFLSFLNTFSSQDSEPSEDVETSDKDANGDIRHYQRVAKSMLKKDRITLEVDFDHIQIHDRDFSDRILTNYYLHEKTLRKAANEFIKPLLDPDQEKSIEYHLSLFNVGGELKVRDLRTNFIGQLTRVIGTVTRTTQVLPELVQGHFTCLECRTVQDLVDQHFRYTEPMICKNPTCQNRKSWYLQVDKSVFCDFQRVRVQENASEIPAGSMPRTIDVVVRHELADRAKPGDRCVFTGSLVAVPDLAQMRRAAGERTQAVREPGQRSTFATEGVTGLRSLGVRELNYRLVFVACAVHQADLNGGFTPLRDDRDEELAEQFDEQTIRDAARIQRTPNLYSRMVSSVCPTVFGHEEIKKGLLLMMLGGVHKKTPTGTRLRGDINVCIVGDPSCAKSQFLKYVADFAPRAVYTSGKASSAAGLTASVVKDPETGEFSIEAGALMLADNGVCCIDEFDKMDLKDQVAIHEAMEQQTISIAKAGIQATLHARTSILAAANPRDGRYDRSKPLKFNVDISAPIMSRFDLFFVLLDECNPIADYNIARHIVDVHLRRDAATPVDFTKDELQRYVRYVRATVRPRLTEETKAKLVEFYRELRENDCTGAQRSSYRITVRQLESMIRLSEAIAKLHCDETIQVRYVEEAKRLLKMSIIHVDSADVSLDDFEALEDEGSGGGGDDDNGGGGGGGGGGGSDGDGGDGGDGGDDGGRGQNKRGGDGARDRPPRGGAGSAGVGKEAPADEESCGGDGGSSTRARRSARRSGGGVDAVEATAAGSTPSKPRGGADDGGGGRGRKRRHGGDSEATAAKDAAAAAAAAAAADAAAAEARRAVEAAATAASKAGAGAEPAEAGKRQRLEISQDEFDVIANLLMRELRRVEDLGQEDLTQEQLIEWYLNQREDLDMEEDFVLARRTACAIVQKLITQDGLVLVTNQEEAEALPSIRQRRDARRLSVHPNYLPPS